jgi:threonyl-tRNA synthetase
MLEECTKVIRLVLDIYEQLSFTDIHIKLSTRPENRMGDDATWDLLESALVDSLDNLNMDYALNPGEGAFYGPKLEFVLRDAIGRDWQCGTLQVDMNLPTRFKLDYVDQDGGRRAPVMLHRALFGSLERFTGILIEHFEGKFPAWLAPVQVAVLTISEKFEDYAEKTNHVLETAGLRTDLDLSKEKVGYKIRQQTLKKVPFMMIIGANEAKSGEVTLRARGGDQVSFENIEGALSYLKEEGRPPDIVDHQQALDKVVETLKAANTND